MKKNLPLIIGGGVAIVALVAIGWWFLGRGEQVSEPTSPEEVGEQAPTREGESFVGELKDALTLGQSMKCTWKRDESNYATSYIKDDKIRTEVAQADKKMHSIMKDNCNYSWQEGESQGFKVCFEPAEAEEFEEVEEGEAAIPEGITEEMPDYQYDCEPAVISESMFNLPAGVNFLSAEEMMGGLGE